MPKAIQSLLRLSFSLFALLLLALTCLLLFFGLRMRAKALHAYYEPYMNTTVPWRLPLLNGRLMQDACFAQRASTSVAIVTMVTSPSPERLLCTLAHSIRHFTNADMLVFTTHAMDRLCGWKYCLWQTLSASSVAHVQLLLPFYDTLLFLDYATILPFQQPLFFWQQATLTYTPHPHYVLAWLCAEHDTSLYLMMHPSYQRVQHPADSHSLKINTIFLIFAGLDPSSLWSCLQNTHLAPICFFWQWIAYAY